MGNGDYIRVDQADSADRLRKSWRNPGEDLGAAGAAMAVFDKLV